MLVAVFLFRKIMSTTWEGIDEKSKPNLKLDQDNLEIKANNENLLKIINHNSIMRNT
jgi:hypothetical protein